MGALRRILLNTISLLFIAVLAILIVENWPVSTPLLLPNGAHASASLGGIILTGAILAMVPAIMRQWLSVGQIQNQIKQFELRREKAEVKAEVNQDQVRVLEAKIQTLEKALDQALSQKGSS